MEKLYIAWVCLVLRNEKHFFLILFELEKRVTFGICIGFLSCILPISAVTLDLPPEKPLGFFFSSLSFIIPISASSTFHLLNQT